MGINPKRVKNHFIKHLPYFLQALHMIFRRTWKFKVLNFIYPDIPLSGALNLCPALWSENSASESLLLLQLSLAFCSLCPLDA